MRHIKNYAQAKAIMEMDLRLAEAQAKRHYDEVREALENPEGAPEELRLLNLREEDVERARRHLDVYLPKYRKRWEERLKAADAAGRMVSIDIHVRWSRNRTWDRNPTAEAWLCFEDGDSGANSAYGIGRASGCGYDKASAAVQEALCFNVKRGDDAAAKEAKRKAIASLDRFVIEHGEALWKEYAVDRVPFPHLNCDSKGMGALTRLFRHIGRRPCGEYAVKDFLIDCRETPDSDDVYHIVRKDRV